MNTLLLILSLATLCILALLYRAVKALRNQLLASTRLLTNGIVRCEELLSPKPTTPEAADDEIPAFEAEFAHQAALTTPPKPAVPRTPRRARDRAPSVVE